MSKDVSIVFGADFHIGNEKISAAETHLNLINYFFPKVKKSNIVILGGDFFHKLLKLDDQAALESLSIVQELIDYANENNAIIRVVRGTFSHDRLQNNIFTSVISKLHGDVNLAYIDNVQLEYIKEYDLKLLYLPDNLKYKNTLEVYDYIKSLLQTYGWDSVDIVAGHGYFEHVFPATVPHLPNILYRWEDFDKFVNGYVLFGHVHTSKVYHKVIYSGSFERFVHNEEEPKGFYCVYRRNDKWSYEFIENKDTPYFYTINLESTDKSELIQQVETFVKDKFKDRLNGYLRIYHPNVELKDFVFDYAKSRYTYLIVTAKSVKETQNKKVDIAQLKTCSYIVPTKDNIPKFIIDYVVDVKGSTVLTEDIIKEVLQL